MLLSISIGNFLTNYDITNRKFQFNLTYSIVQKRTNWEKNNAMETTETTKCLMDIAVIWQFSFIKSLKESCNNGNVSVLLDWFCKTNWQHNCNICSVDSWFSSSAHLQLSTKKLIKFDLKHFLCDDSYYITLSPFRYLHHYKSSFT